jgi:hypothetical protein
MNYFRIADHTPGTGTIFFNGLGPRRPRSYQQRLGPFEKMPTHSVHATAIQVVGLRQPASQSLGQSFRNIAGAPGMFVSMQGMALRYS